MEISFKDVSFNYHNQAVLHQLNFKIPDGKLTTILGPSGCGKSTMLMLMAGLLTPSTGQLYFDQTLATTELCTAKVGLVFQDYALYPHLTVLENIAFPLKMQHVKKRVRHQRAQELAQLMQLEDCLSKKPQALSGGQQQRVAIARALAKEPEILLLDEPLSNLDARLRLAMRAELKRLQAKLKITMVVVTHDQDEAMHLAQKMLVLKAGYLQQFAEPLTIYQQPANLFVARFIGTPVINCLTVAQCPTDWQLPPNTTTVAIRPESIVAVTHESAHNCVYQSHVQRLTTQRFGSEIWTELQLQQQVLLSTGLSDSLAAETTIGILKNGLHYYDQNQQLIDTGGCNYESPASDD